MNEEDIKKLIDVRQHLITAFEKCKDWHNNKNAIMREMDHAECVHQAVVKIDKILENYVSFGSK